VPSHLHGRIEGRLVVHDERLGALASQSIGDGVDDERGVVTASLDLRTPVRGHGTCFPHTSILPSSGDTSRPAEKSPEPEHGQSDTPRRRRGPESGRTSGASRNHALAPSAWAPVELTRTGSRSM